jgi:hypothetical protein
MNSLGCGTGKMHCVTKIKDVSVCFELFAESMLKINYCVEMEAIRFVKSQAISEFSINELKEIFGRTEESISGEVCKVSFEAAKKDINRCLIYKSLCKRIIKNAGEMERRQRIFWGIIYSYFDGNIDSAFEYTPNFGNYFVGPCVWLFSYIFFDSKNNGIFISAEASH